MSFVSALAKRRDAALASCPRIGACFGAGPDNFALLRLLLAAAVVVSHGMAVGTGRYEDELFVVSTGFSLGSHAVNGFFAISGFLVTMSFDRRGWNDYVVARLLRIYPAFIVGALVVAFGFGLAFTTLSASAYLSHPQVTSFLVRVLTEFRSNGTLPGFLTENPYKNPYGTIWTLRYELFCYILVLVAGLWGGRLVQRFAWVGLVGLLAAVIALDTVKALTGYTSLLETYARLFSLFVAGSLAYQHRDRVPLSGFVLALLVVVVVALAWTPLYRAALYVTTVYAVLVLALHPALVGHVAEPRSDLSYGIYLYGWPVQQTVQAVYPMHWLAMLAPVFVATLILALLSWHLVEKPALRLKGRLIRSGQGGTGHGGTGQGGTGQGA
jgi:peptidoglycan/LPS O-acetylase OafA/YrhL